jgi:hypothetical protein
MAADKHTNDILFGRFRIAPWDNGFSVEAEKLRKAGPCGGFVTSTPPSVEKGGRRLGGDLVVTPQGQDSQSNPERATQENQAPSRLGGHGGLSEG